MTRGKQIQYDWDEIMRLQARGLSVRAIARQMGIQEMTLVNAMRRRRDDLAEQYGDRDALRHGLLAAAVDVMFQAKAAGDWTAFSRLLPNIAKMGGAAEPPPAPPQADGDGKVNIPLLRRWLRDSLRPVQRKAMYNDARIALFEGMPQGAGKTIAAAHWLADYALTMSPPQAGEQQKVVWWASAVYEQTRNAQRIFKSALEEYNVGEFLEREIRFNHGVLLKFVTAKGEETNYGTTVHAMVIDEASDISEDSYGALMSRTTTTMGPIRIIGNRRGRGYFYQMCRAAEAGKSEHHFTRMNVDDALAQGVIDQEAYDDHKQTVPPAKWEEEYMLNDVDALNPFVGYTGRVGAISDSPTVCYGVDIARYPAYYSIVGMDLDGAVSYEKEWRGQAYNTSAAMVAEITAGLPVLVDATGAEAHMEQLRKAGVNAHPFVISSESRQELLENLAIGIASDDVTITEFVREQMALFEIHHSEQGVRYQSTDKERVGDDRVFAAALAYWLLTKGTQVRRGSRRRRR